MNKRALVVGIDEYADTSIMPLRCAEQDAWRMSCLLEDCGFEVRSLIGRNATRTALNGTVDELCLRLRADDVFFFYFAGHGNDDAQGHHRILTWAVQRLDLQAGDTGDTIPVRSLARRTARCGAARVLVLDACRSPLERDRGEDCAALAESTARDLGAIAKGAAETAPLTLISSCAPDQRAHELAELRSGVFTEALKRVVRNKQRLGHAVVLPADLEDMRRVMADLLLEHRVPEAQEPRCEWNGHAVTLLEPDAETTQAPPHTSPPPVPETKWHVTADGRVIGPFSAGEFRDRAAELGLTAQTMVWRPGAPEWVAAGTEPELRELLGEREAVTRPVPPAPPPPFPSPAAPARGRDLTLDLGEGVSLELTWIEPGSFMMGARGVAEPVHKVTISRGFLIGRYPVTQEQYKAVTGSNPSTFENKPEHPVETVSWNDACKFCVDLELRVADQVRGPLQVRLPTEAEWEYACRAGTDTEYNIGDGEMALQRAGWYSGNSGQSTQPAGRRHPNAWGLHDMHGNVWEWCGDWYGEYSRKAVTDPTGSGSGSGRVVRGGSWGDDGYGCRSANRFWDDPSSTYNFIGFRVVLSF